MARQHGYIAMIPVFIPVEKNNLANQVAAGRALSEVVHTRDLSAIMALPGIRFHPPRPGKDIITRYTSVPVEGEAEQAGDPNPDVAQQVSEGENGPVFETVEAETTETAEADPTPDEADAVTTKGRRRSA